MDETTLSDKPRRRAKPNTSDETLVLWSLSDNYPFRAARFAAGFARASGSVFTPGFSDSCARIKASCARRTNSLQLIPISFAAASHRAQSCATASSGRRGFRFCLRRRKRTTLARPVVIGLLSIPGECTHVDAQPQACYSGKMGKFFGLWALAVVGCGSPFTSAETAGAGGEAGSSSSAGVAGTAASSSGAGGAAAGGSSSGGSSSGGSSSGGSSSHAGAAGSSSSGAGGAAAGGSSSHAGAAGSSSSGAGGASDGACLVGWVGSSCDSCSSSTAVSGSQSCAQILNCYIASHCAGPCEQCEYQVPTSDAVVAVARKVYACRCP